MLLCVLINSIYTLNFDVFSSGEAFKVEVKTIAFDYSSVSGYEEIEKVLKNLNIAILGKIINQYGSGFVL